MPSQVSVTPFSKIVSELGLERSIEPHAADALPQPDGDAIRYDDGGLQVIGLNRYIPRARTP